MHPILFKVGWFHLPTYGVCLALALVAALYVVVRLGRREGLDTGQLIDFSTWIIITGLVGAKVLFVITEWDDIYRAHPGQIFSLATLEAGGVIYGGLIAGLVFAVWYIKTYKLPMRKVFDVCAPAVALGQSIGRVGCTSAGCEYGIPFHGWFSLTFTNPYSHALTGVPLGVPLFPWQPVASVMNLTIFGILMWRYRYKVRDGEIFLLYLVLYAVGRFSLEFLRGDADRGFVFHHLLSTSQFIAVLMVGLAGALGWFWFGRGKAATSRLAAKETASGKHGGQVSGPPKPAAR
jgi:phosphatidylglycerol---prolipoprotein diacylglyceryl transferase